MLYREWNLREADTEKTEALAAATGAGRLLSRVLVARGMDTPETAAKILAPQPPLPDPFTMQDMDKAVRRIQTAVQNEELIAVFGDYDVDGITATALLFTYLEHMGANVFYKLPSRNDDDYGLSPTLVDAMADKGITLIVTVDNGTTAFEAAERAAERGVSLVVTDHHLPYDTLPQVDALINPCREDDESELSGLSGAGVAFMLLAALEGCGADELLPVFGDLAAIGTVADVMKLCGPNRAIVKVGLEVLQSTERPGLKALMEVCGCRHKELTVENISYGLAPRLNAAGRMDDATAALQLLLAEDDDEAIEMVEGLQQQNAARQKAEAEILALIETEIEQDPKLGRSRVLVLSGDGWHQGVIGIVASRLVDRYAKPAIVISFDENEGKGSGRSVNGFSLHGAIASCEDILLRYGGHDLAAGFSIKREHLDEFRRRVNEWAVENSPIPSLPELWADAEVNLESLALEEVRQLGRLDPCGSGNPAPRFLLRGASIDGVYPVSEGRHSRLRFRQGGSCLYAVLFGTGPQQLAYRQQDTVDVLVALSLYNGRSGEQVSARIIEMRPAGMGNAHVGQSALFEYFQAGGRLNDDQRGLLRPSRDDTACLYRAVRGGQDVSAVDLRPAFLRLGEEKTGKILASLAALEELKLIEQGEDGRYHVVQVSQKRDLAESTLLQRLAADAAK